MNLKPDSRPAKVLKLDDCIIIYMYASVVVQNFTLENTYMKQRKIPNSLFVALPVFIIII